MQSIFTFRPGKKIDNVKTCNKCQNYESKNERCKLFGNMNLVNGNLEYNFASYERNDIGNCGPDAKYWKGINTYANKTQKKEISLSEIRRNLIDTDIIIQDDFSFKNEI